MINSTEFESYSFVQAYDKYFGKEIEVIIFVEYENMTQDFYKEEAQLHHLKLEHAL